MTKTAFLYAGQGSQHRGMGKDLYKHFQEYREFLDSLDLDFDIKEMSFVNSDGRLDQTEYTQPCMAAFACGVNQILRARGLRPDYVCGLSLGEYPALNMADVWDAKKTVEITAYRGKVMAQASAGIAAGMMAVIGLDDEQVKDCCTRAAEYGIVSACNFNCPGQIVIGGEKAAVEKAAALAKEMGARRCLPLNVSGPFHTCLMKPAGDALEKYFRSVTFHEPTAEVLYNYLGGPLTSGTIADVLVQQVQRTVHMESIIRYLFGQGVARFVEIGPGTALSGFVKKTAKMLGIDGGSYKMLTVETVEDIDGLMMEEGWTDGLE